MQTERHTDSERVSRQSQAETAAFYGGVGRAGEKVAGGAAEPGLGERGVLLLHDGRGAEVPVLVELVERPTLR